MPGANWRLSSSLLLLASSSPRVAQSFTKRGTWTRFLYHQQREHFRSTTTHSIQPAMTSSSSSSLPTVSEYLKTVKANPPNHICLGNPAGDADSIISAIALGYISSYLPIVSVPMQDLKSLRPETKFLLSLAGITDLEEHLVAIDNNDGLINTDDDKDVLVSLVDHNKLTLESSSWTVTEILDHHLDEGAHVNTCSGDQQRVIAFDSEKSAALVASTCTLMVERFLRLHSTSSTPNTVSFPPTLAILLLGVILLDSINLSPKAGKVTQRDILAVEALQSQTNWKALSSLPADLKMGNSQPDDNNDDPHRPNLTTLFETLQNQKFHPDFWKGLTALQAIKLDYKSFTVDSAADNKNDSVISFGVSSILQTISEFFLKANVIDAVREEMKRQNLQFFALMHCDFSGDTPKRQLTMICPNQAMAQSMLQFLKQQETLQVDVLEEQTEKEDGFHVVFINQGNPKASRKQVAPIFMEYFKQQQQQQESKL